MSWLSQDWIWVLVAVGVGYYFLRGDRGSHRGSLDGLPGGLVQEGHGGGNGHGDHAGQPGNSAASQVPEATVDPINGDPVRTDKALTSLYQGRVNYFASKEYRDRFEAAPQEHAQNAAGHPVRPVESANERPRRRHGC